MKPEPLASAQESHVVLKMDEEVSSPPEASANLGVEKRSDLKEEPEPWHDDGVVDEKPETLHRPTSCCTKAKEGGDSPALADEDPTYPSPQGRDVHDGVLCHIRFVVSTVDLVKLISAGNSRQHKEMYNTTLSKLTTPEEGQCVS